MMDKLSQLRRRLLFYLRRDRFDSEPEEEMRFHLEMKAQENIEAVVKPEDPADNPSRLVALDDDSDLSSSPTHTQLYLAGFAVGFCVTAFHSRFTD
jgi:hypothetical protein